MLLGYMGPDVILPVSSIVATIVGIVLMFGRVGFRLVLGVVRALNPWRSAATISVPSDDRRRRRPDGPHEAIAGPIEAARGRERRQNLKD